MKLFLRYNDFYWRKCIKKGCAKAFKNGIYTEWQPFCSGLNVFNTLRLGQNFYHFLDDSFKCIFFNENVWISIKISLKFVLQGPINDIPALVQIMVWHWPGDKPLSEPMMVRLLMHICIPWPQWVKSGELNINSPPPGQNAAPPFRRWYFQMHLLEWWCVNFA